MFHIICLQNDCLLNKSNKKYYGIYNIHINKMKDKRWETRSSHIKRYNIILS